MTSESSFAACSGVLVVDKERGPTSHDVVSRARRALGTRAVGHAGTLDPMASGVLVLAVGEATKLVSWLTAHDKAYEATIALGAATDTLDAEGSETRRQPIDDALAAALASPERSTVLAAAFERERQRTLQVPPQFSAIKTDGARSFARARRGETVALEPRPVSVKSLDLLAAGASPPSLVVSIVASKGYYVRSLARDLAEALGNCGHLTSLRRTRSGPFALDEAVRVDASPETLRAHLQSPSRAAARALPVAHLRDPGVQDARHGRTVHAADIDARSQGPCAWLDEHGALVAIGDVLSDGRGRVLRGFDAAYRRD